MTGYWHVLPPLLFLLLWLPIRKQETDNSGTYGGQEVMQINVSQHQYFLALQSPCREEVWGQLSIIGPQLSWLVKRGSCRREREGGGWRRRDAEEMLEVREQGLWFKGRWNWQNIQKRMERGEVRIHVLHIHDGPFYSILFISTCASALYSCCVSGCRKHDWIMCTRHTMHYFLFCTRLLKGFLWFLTTC